MPSATKENKLIVFLSHASEDKPMVRKLYKRLEADGFAPWLDEKRLLPGQNWNLEIDGAMRSSHAILLCFSKASLAKDGYVQREYKKALEWQLDRPPGAIYVIPVRLDHTEIPDFLNSLQCVDYPGKYNKLALSLRKVEEKVFASLVVPPAQAGTPPQGMPPSVKKDRKIPKGTTSREDLKQPSMPETASKHMPPSETGEMELMDRIFGWQELTQLVQDSFPNSGDLQRILAGTFPAGWAGPGANGFIVEFVRNHEISRLLGEIKKHNPDGYRDFLAARALAPIGLSSQEIPVIGADPGTLQDELLGLRKAAIAQKRAERGRAPDDGTLEFEDREGWFSQVRFGKEDHIVLHGPSGVGKTYFLKQLQQRNQRDTCCVLIDLSLCKSEDLLGLLIEQLGGDAGAADQYQEIAYRIATLHGETHTRRFYFLFDNADHNQAAIDYLFSPENLIDNPNLLGCMETWELTGRIQMKIVIAARHPLQPADIYPAFSNAVQIKIQPLDRFSVHNMLDLMVGQRKIPVPIGRIEDLGNKVYYLTGGHPRCTKQMLLALVEQRCVVADEEAWVKLYREHVIPIIHSEMLQPDDPKLLSTIWNLSIFRRFDPSLLKGLLDRGILPARPGDTLLQASELRTRLEKTNLFDTESQSSTIITNYVMRHALSLNLQLDAPHRYKTLHAVALQIYLDRFLGSEPGPEKQIERLAVNLLELLYHWTKLLEMEPRAKARQVCPKIRNAFEAYLQLALTMLRQGEQPDFFKILRSRWKEDDELQEAVRRSAPGEDCLQELRGIFQKYDPPQGGRDWAGVNQMSAGGQL